MWRPLIVLTMCFCGCTSGDGLPRAVCAPMPDLGELIVIAGREARLPVAPCAIEPERVEVRIVDGEGVEFGATWVREGSGPSFVRFTAPRPGSYDMFLRYLPSAATRQLPVRAAFNHLDAGTLRLSLPRRYAQLDEVTASVWLGFGENTLDVLVDAGTQQQIPARDFARSGATVWSTWGAELRRYQLDAGRLSAAAATRCADAGRVFAGDSTHAWAECEGALWNARISDDGGVALARRLTLPTGAWVVAWVAPWGMFAGGDRACIWDAESEVSDCVASAWQFPHVPPAIDPHGVWQATFSDLIHRAPLADGGLQSHNLRVAGRLVPVGGGRGTQLFSIDGQPEVFAVRRDGGHLELHAYPPSPAPVEASERWIRAQTDTGQQFFYPR